MMHEHPCTDVRERLEAFYDGELSVDERVAIQNHLGDCVACNLTAQDLGMLGASLRELAAQTADRTSDEPLRISARVLERVRVEEQFSMKAQMRGLFQDMHLVWAGLGATVSTLICVIGSASVLHAANQQLPGSFANTISILANPGSNENPMRLNYEMLVAPKDDARPLGVMASPIEMTEEEAEYALAAVVSREGRVQGVEMINQSRVMPRSVNAMLHDAYRVQFAPAQDRGDAVAVRMVWLVANTTVKGRHEDDVIEAALRGALRARTAPLPIAPLPVPEVAEPKPAIAPLVKPVVPDTIHASLAAGLGE